MLNEIDGDAVRHGVVDGERETLYLLAMQWRIWQFKENKNDMKLVRLRLQ